MNQQFTTECTKCGGGTGQKYPCGCAARAQAEPFQQRVQPWMMACFGGKISANTWERNHRFFEEATELVQACALPRAEAHMLVDYVYARPLGAKEQEVGGVMVTLAALCLAQGIDMHDAAEVELARIWTKVEAIRTKQATKPKNSPLPTSPCGASWTPSTRKTMPDDDITVLLALSDGEVWQGYHDGEIWRDTSGMPIASARVTHWMHVPAHPESPAPGAIQSWHTGLPLPGESRG